MADPPRLFGSSSEPEPSSPATRVIVLCVALGMAGAVVWALRAPSDSASAKGVAAAATVTPARRVPKAVPVPGAMKAVAAGVVHLGGPGGDPDELPAREAKVDAFEIDETEVSVQAYAACVTAGACAAPDKNGACNWANAERTDHPVNCVDHDQAVAYCKFVGRRLPTEAEWEYAAQSDSASPFPWKEGAPGAQACWNGDGNDEGRGKRQGTCPVGAYPAGASRFGALDMAGNVFEWTDSPYCPYDKPDCGDPQRVIRGGSWNNFVGGYLRVKDRSKEATAARNGNIGFRCVK